MKTGSSQSYADRAPIQSPASLSVGRDHGFFYEHALFGPAPYGESIVESVIYAESDACSGLDVTQGLPARPLDPTTGLMEAWKGPFILMVDRGGECSFVEKVGKHEEQLGLAAINFSALSQ